MQTFEKNYSIPVAVFVIDCFNWAVMGNLTFNPANWPTPKAMVDTLKSYGTKMMVSTWPFSQVLYKYAIDTTTARTRTAIPVWPVHGRPKVTVCPPPRSASNWNPPLSRFSLSRVSVSVSIPISN